MTPPQPPTPPHAPSPSAHAERPPADPSAEAGSADAPGTSSAWGGGPTGPSGSSGSAPDDRPARRRARYAALTALLLVALVAAAVFAVALAERHAPRFDLTQTRQHSLAPRTLAAIDTLQTEADLVAVLDFSSLDAAARTRLLDLLEAIDSAPTAGPGVRVRLVDVSAPDASARYAAAVAGVRARFAPQIASHANAIRSAGGETGAVAADVAALARELDRLGAGRAGLTERQVERASRALALLAAELRAAADTLPGLIPGADAPADADVPAGTAVAPTGPLPRTGEARELVADPLRRTASALGDLEAAAARPVARAAGALRDRALAAADRLGTLPDLAPARLEALLRETEAIIVAAGPTDGGQARTAAVTRDQLLAGPDPAAAVDARAETLLTAAIETAASPVTPMVVFLHGETARVLDGSGRPTPAAAGAFGSILRDLELRNIPVAEWPVALSPLRPERPELVRGLALDPADVRPVWFLLGPPSPGSAATADAAVGGRAERLEALAGAVAGLINAGENVLATVLPSELPAVGEPDPLAEALEPLGVRARTGSPVVAVRSTPEGRSVDINSVVRARREDGGPVAMAIAGLPTLLRLAPPLERIAGVGARVEPVLVRPAGAEVWGESRWLELGRRAGAVSRERVPTPDPGADVTDGPWPLVLAAERARGAADPHAIAPRGEAVQRLVAVSGAQWFGDPITTATGVVDGRPAPRFPGNRALFHASVLWLAGLDDRLAPGPRSADVPRVAELSPGALAAVRWSLIAGLPLLVLAAAGAYALSRRG